MRNIIVALFLATILATSYHYTSANQSYERVRYLTSQHYAIANGDAPSPYRYRVLVPFTAEMVSRLMDYPLTEGKLLLAYSVLHMLILPAAFLALNAYITSVTDERGGLVAMGVVFVAWPIMTQVYHSYLVWAFVEMTLLCLVILWRDRPLLCGVLIVLAVFNRETGVFIGLAYFVTHWRSLRAYAYLIMVAAMVAGLRLSLGIAPHESSASASFHELLSQTLVFNLLFSPLWIAAWRGRKAVSTDLQRIALIISLPYVAFLLAFASLREVRLYLTLMPLLLPLAIRGVFRVKEYELEQNLRRAMKDVKAGRVYPIETLWNDEQKQLR